MIILPTNAISKEKSHPPEILAYATLLPAPTSWGRLQKLQLRMDWMCSRAKTQRVASANGLDHIVEHPEMNTPSTQRSRKRQPEHQYNRFQMPIFPGLEFA